MKNLIPILALFFIIGCGSRKKALDKSEVKTATQSESQTDFKEVKDVKKKSVSDTKVIVIKSDTDTQFEGSVSDKTKPASIEEETTAQGRKTTFTNFDKVNTSSKYKDNKSDIAITDTRSEIDKSIIDLTQKEQAKESKEETEKVLNVDRKGNTMIAFWIVLAIGILAYGFFSIKKKTFDPLGFLALLRK